MGEIWDVPVCGAVDAFVLFEALSVFLLRSILQKSQAGAASALGSPGVRLAAPAAALTGIPDEEMTIPCLWRWGFRGRI